MFLQVKSDCFDERNGETLGWVLGHFLNFKQFLWSPFLDPWVALGYPFAFDEKNLKQLFMSRTFCSDKWFDAVFEFLKNFLWSPLC
jgi:hypothetical protein